MTDWLDDWNEWKKNSKQNCNTERTTNNDARISIVCLFVTINIKSFVFRVFFFIQSIFVRAFFLSVFHCTLSVFLFVLFFIILLCVLKVGFFCQIESMYNLRFIHSFLLSISVFNSIFFTVSIGACSRKYYRIATHLKAIFGLNSFLSNCEFCSFEILIFWIIFPFCLHLFQINFRLLHAVYVHTIWHVIN